MCSITIDTKVLRKPHTPKQLVWMFLNHLASVNGDFSRVGDIEVRLATPMRHTTLMRQHCMRHDYKLSRCSIYDHSHSGSPYLCLSRYFVYIVFTPFLPPFCWPPLITSFSDNVPLTVHVSENTRVVEHLAASEAHSETCLYTASESFSLFHIPEDPAPSKSPKSPYTGQSSKASTLSIYTSLDKVIDS